MKYIKTAFLFAAPWVTFQLFSQRLALPLGSKQEDGRRERGRGAGRRKGGKEGGLRGRKRRKELGRGRRGEKGGRRKTGEEKGQEGGKRWEGGGKEWTSSTQTPARQCPCPKAGWWEVGGGRWEVEYFLPSDIHRH